MLRSGEKHSWQKEQQMQRHWCRNSEGCLRSRKKASVTEPNRQDENGGKEDRVRPCRRGSDYVHGKQPKFYSVTYLDTINKI